MSVEISKKALEYLKENKLISLATISSDNKPWAATTFFAYDEDFTILFFLRSDTRHCQNISQNPRIAATINQVWGKPGKVKGIQLEGVVEKLEFGHSTRFFEIFRSRYLWMDQYADHSLYKIVPSEVWYLDDEYFGHFFRVRVL